MQRLPALSPKRNVREVSSANASLAHTTIIGAGGGRFSSGGQGAQRAIRTAEPLPPINGSGVGRRSILAAPSTTTFSLTQPLQAINARAKTLPVIVHYIVRPHLPPVYTDVAIVPAEARADDITLCAANTFFAYCDSLGAVLGPLPSNTISDYGLFFLRPHNLRSIEINRMAAACAEAIHDPWAFGEDCDDYDEFTSTDRDTFSEDGDGDEEGGNKKKNQMSGRGGGKKGREGEDPTYDTARRPTIAANLPANNPFLFSSSPFSSDLLRERAPAELAGRRGDSLSSAISSAEAMPSNPQKNNNNNHNGQYNAPEHNETAAGGTTPKRRRAGKGAYHQQQGRKAAATFTTESITLPPQPPHPSHSFLEHDRTELEIVENDFKRCHGRAVMLRFIQSVCHQRSALEVARILQCTRENASASDGTPSSSSYNHANDDDKDGPLLLDGDDDPAIVAAKVRARIEALYTFNKRAGEDALDRERDEEASLLHAQIAGLVRPVEVYFCVTAEFLKRETTVFEEEERRAAIELVWESSWDKLLAYAALWRQRSQAAEVFRITNAASRQQLQNSEEKIRAKVAAKEEGEWNEKFANFAERFEALEWGMLAQFHHLRKLRERHRDEIDRRILLGAADGEQQPEDKEEEERDEGSYSSRTSNDGEPS